MFLKASTMTVDDDTSGKDRTSNRGASSSRMRQWKGAEDNPNQVLILQWGKVLQSTIVGTHLVDNLLKVDIHSAAIQVGVIGAIVDEHSNFLRSNLLGTAPEDEEHGVDDIGLATPIWSHYGREILGKKKKWHRKVQFKEPAIKQIQFHLISLITE